MIMTNIFEGIVRFFKEKRNKTYVLYVDVSISNEKRARTQKVPATSQLCWFVEGAGL